MINERWTESAIECYERGCICKGCNMYELLGSNCRMKSTVIRLVRDIGKPENAKTNNYVHTSKGGNDECYTPRYGVEPLLEFMPKFKNKIIWCPFDKEESEFVKVFRDNGYNVVFSHIENGQDFFTYEPKKWDVMISNPPFTNKSDIFKRAIKFNKPFALLNTILWLNDAPPTKLFKNYDLQLLLFVNRMTFKNQPQDKKINFKSIYYCHNFLDKQIEIRDFDYGQQHIF